MAVEGRVVKQKVSWNAALSKVSTEAALLFTWAIPHADKRGRLPGDPKQLKAKIVPMLDQFTPAVVARCAEELQADGVELVRWYAVGHRAVFELRGFEDEQSGSQLKRERESELPAWTPEARKLPDDGEGTRTRVGPFEVETDDRMAEDVIGVVTVVDGKPHAQVIPLFPEGLRRGDAEEVAPAWNGAAIVKLYADVRTSKGWPRLGPKDMGKQGAVAKRIAAQYGADEVMAAMVGMEALFPHSKGEPWDLFDLERKWAKAIAATANHPSVQRERFLREFEA